MFVVPVRVFSFYDEAPLDVRAWPGCSKPVKANPGLKVNVFALLMLLEIFQTQKTETQTI